MKLRTKMRKTILKSVQNARRPLKSLPKPSKLPPKTLPKPVPDPSRMPPKSNFVSKSLPWRKIFEKSREK